MVSFDEFQKIELKIGRVIFAERVEGSEKLLRLSVSLGDDKRQILSGIARAYSPEDLVGKEIIVVANLAPRIIMGMESNGMVLAAIDDDGMPVVIHPGKDVPEGAEVR